MDLLYLNNTKYHPEGSLPSRRPKALGIESPGCNLAGPTDSGFFYFHKKSKNLGGSSPSVFDLAPIICGAKSLNE